MLRRFALALLPMITMASIASADDVISLGDTNSRQFDAALASIFDDDLPVRAADANETNLEEADAACWRFRGYGYGYRCYRPSYSYCYRPICYSYRPYCYRSWGHSYYPRRYFW